MNSQRTSAPLPLLKDANPSRQVALTAFPLDLFVSAEPIYHNPLYPGVSDSCHSD